MDIEKKYTDEFIKQLIKKTDVDKPSKRFTLNVMENIYKEAEKVIPVMQPSIFKRYWYLFALPIVISLASFAIYHFHLYTYLPKIEINYQFDFSLILQSLNSIFESFTILSLSPLMICLFSATALLGVIDLLFRKRVFEQVGNL